MTDKNQIKQYLQDRLQGLESIKKDREWTTAELGDVACCKQTLAFIDSLQEEPVSDDLEEAAKNYEEDAIFYAARKISDFFKAGAQWQKDHTCFAGRIETIEEIKEVLLSEVLPCFMHGGEADEVVAKLDEVLNQK